MKYVSEQMDHCALFVASVVVYHIIYPFEAWSFAS